MAGLTELRDLLRREGRASLESLALRSGSDASAVEAMLAHWLRKGRVARHQAEAHGCGGCGSCGGSCSGAAVVYEWVGD